MVKAICRFNAEKVKKMSVRLRNKTLIGSAILGAILLFLGVFNIISAFSREDAQKWLFLILGILICIFAFYPLISGIFTHKKNYKDTLEAMQLDKGDVILEFLIKEKKIELKATQNDEVSLDTILIRNLNLIKVHHDGIGIYLGENMYYICNDEIVQGTRESLLRIFKNAGILIKKG